MSEQTVEQKVQYEMDEIGIGREEAVRQWEEALEFIRQVQRGFATEADPPELPINYAIKQLVWDAHDRAMEALRRARERAESERKGANIGDSES